MQTVWKRPVVRRCGQYVHAAIAGLSHPAYARERRRTWMAKMFWGLLMGLVMPPRLDASAMPARGRAAVNPYPVAHA